MKRYASLARLMMSCVDRVDWHSSGFCPTPSTISARRSVKHGRTRVPLNRTIAFCIRVCWCCAVAVRGSPISVWAPARCNSQTGSKPYDDAFKRIRAAKMAGEFKSVLWHQGESDSGEAATPDYEARTHAHRAAERRGEQSCVASAHRATRSICRRTVERGRGRGSMLCIGKSHGRLRTWPLFPLTDSFTRGTA